MRILDTYPVLYCAYPFKYVWQSEKYPRLSLPKTQYTYRFIYFAEGEAAICVNGQTQHCKAGDVVFLIPGSTYRILPWESDFMIYNVYFHFSCCRENPKRAACVFFEEFDSALCLPTLSFSDAKLLNKSRIVRGYHHKKDWERLISLHKTDPYYEFHALSIINSIFSRIIQVEQQGSLQNSGVQEILSYIRSHPGEDLSAAELSEKFSFHKNYINQLIKQATGKTLSDYIRSVKIEYAQALLSDGVASLTQIAIMLGYYDYSHFYKAFIAETGMSPTEYIRNM